MIPLPQYHGKTVGVVGLGKSGLATIAALEQSGARVLAWDDGQAEKGYSPVPLTHYDDWPWAEIADLILSPGVPLHHPTPHPSVIKAQAAGCRVIGDIELLLTTCPQAYVIGITGTNGKSTTTALIAHILQQAGRRVEVGGNLGTPALSLAALEAEGIYVLELSSYQLELLDKARIHCGCLLNVTPDHLDRHGDMAGYVAAKRRMFRHQQAGDTAIIAVDDAYTQAVGQSVAQETRRLVPVSVTEKVMQGVWVNAHGMLQDGDIRIDLTPCLALKGQHNWQNAAVAYAACRAAGATVEQIELGLRSFPGLAHRMERVTTLQGVTFVNDSKATNADAAAKALGSYDTIYWIAGGLPKEGGITTLGAYFPRIRKAYLIGQAAVEFARTLEGQVDYELCGTLEVATRRAAEDALRDGLEGACVMLSPACASWDQWPNFEVRGNAFRDYVNALAGEKAA